MLTRCNNKQASSTFFWPTMYDASIESNEGLQTLKSWQTLHTDTNELCESNSQIFLGNRIDWNRFVKWLESILANRNAL